MLLATNWTKALSFIEYSCYTILLYYLMYEVRGVCSQGCEMAYHKRHYMDYQCCAE
jgi:hypothetical protein